MHIRARQKPKAWGMGGVALQYNDVSPLENMHCARLFQICTNAEFDIFEKMTQEKYVEVRKV